jgi:hypothetical protein
LEASGVISVSWQGVASTLAMVAACSAAVLCAETASLGASEPLLWAAAL